MGGASTTISENAATVTTSAPAAATTHQHHKVALGTLIGAIVGAFALGITVVSGFLYWRHRRRQRRKKARNAIANPDAMPHLLDSTQTQDPNRIHELENNHPPSTHELSSPNTHIVPPPGYSLTEQMKDKDGAEAELGSAAEVAELPGGEVPRAELGSGRKWSIRKKRVELGSGSSARSWRKGDDRGA